MLVELSGKHIPPKRSAVIGCAQRASTASTVFRSPAGRVEGSFNTNHAVVLDTWIIKRI